MNIEIETIFKKKLILNYKEIGLHQIVYGSKDGKVWTPEQSNEKFTVNAVAILMDFLYLIPNLDKLEIDGESINLTIDMNEKDVEEKIWGVVKVEYYFKKIIQYLLKRKTIECSDESKILEYTVKRTYKHSNILVPAELNFFSKQKEVFAFYFNTNICHVDFPNLIGTQKQGTVTGDSK